MTASKIFNIISPFTLVTVLGFLMIGDGLVHLGRENNALQFIFGVPVVIFSILFHYLVLRICNHNTVTVWLVEGALVAIVAYLFYYKW
jgi:hypothetical protein